PIGARVAGELVADPLETQPGVRVIHRERAAPRGRAVRGAARLKEGPANAGSGDRASRAAAWSERLARDQSSFGPGIGEAKRIEAHFHIKVATALLVAELKMVVGPADVRPAASDVVAAGDCDLAASRTGAANVQGSVGYGQETS